MRNHEIESWALRILDRVKSGQPIDEDNRVELKADWKDSERIARQLAGHANTARGEPILWLIGVDEKGKNIPGVDSLEFSSWYNAIKAKFNELAPEPIIINVPFNNTTVAALYFETDRGPYVIDIFKDGTVRREVPWREATGTNSATRSQLLRLLSPLQKLPNFEIVNSYLNVDKNGTDQSLTFSCKLFLTQSYEQQTTIPSHQCTITLGIVESENIGPLSGIYFNRDRGKEIVSIKGPEYFQINFGSINLSEQKYKIMYDKKIQIDLFLHPVYIERPIRINIQLLPSGQKGRWSYKFTNLGL